VDASTGNAETPSDRLDDLNIIDFTVGHVERSKERSVHLWYQMSCGIQSGQLVLDSLFDQYPTIVARNHERNQSRSSPRLVQ
jgi:hypothetical protein